MTIERVLPTDETETEFFNRMRVAMGREPITSRVTKIREGLRVRCGPFCQIVEVGIGWFAEHHGDGCHTTNMAGKLEFVGDGKRDSQACASLVDSDGTPITGVLVLSGLFPYERGI